MIKYLIGGAIAAICSHCQPPATTNDRPPCEGQIVYTYEGQTLDCDVSPPQQLDLLIPMPADYQLICDNAGGRITLVDPITSHCADIDY